MLTINFHVKRGFKKLEPKYRRSHGSGISLTCSGIAGVSFKLAFADIGS